MRYNLHRLHYDGSFGDDTCFKCERGIKAVGYERK